MGPPASGVLSRSGTNQLALVARRAPVAHAPFDINVSIAHACVHGAQGAHGPDRSIDRRSRSCARGSLVRVCTRRDSFRSAQSRARARSWTHGPGRATDSDPGAYRRAGSLTSGRFTSPAGVGAASPGRGWPPPPRTVTAGRAAAARARPAKACKFV